MTRDRALFFAVVTLSLGLNATAAWWGLPARFAWAPDELQPPIILKGIEERFSGDWHEPAYPPFHYYVLAASYLPVLALDVDVSGLEGRTLLYTLGRLISLVMGVGVLWWIHRLALELFDGGTALFASIGAAFSAPFVYYAKFANLDVPAAFWVLASLYFFIRHLESGDSRDLLWFAGTGVVAMCTKDQAYAFYVLPVVVYLWRRLRRGDGLQDRRLLAIAGSAAVLFLLIHNVVFNFQGFVHHFEEILWARSHYSAFEADASSQLELLGQTVRHLRFALGAPLTIASVLGIALALRERRANPRPLWLLLAAGSFYLFFVAPVKSTWLRYSVPLALILAVFGGYALSVLWGAGRRWYRAGIVVALGYSLLRAASVDALLLQDSRYDVERWLSDRMKPGEVVGFMGPEYYLPRFDRFDSRRLRPSDSVLERARPDYLVINPDYASRFGAGTREGDLFSRLSAGRAGYALVLTERPAPTGLFLDFEGILGNMAKISPTIEVYERAD